MQPGRFRKSVCASGVLVLLVSALFGATVCQRAPWFGQPDVKTLNMSGAMTLGTLGMAKNWEREGAWALRFAMYWEPASIEYPTPASRTPYTSYPPGSVIPVYALAALTPLDLTPGLVMGYNLFNHWAIAVALALLACLALTRMQLARGPALLLAAVSAALYLWLPSPHWEHLMGFFADQAVMLPFTMFLLLDALEAWTERPAVRRVWTALRCAVALWGMLTGWLFFFVAAAVYVARLATGRMGTRPLPFLGHSAAYWSPIACALALFALQLYHLGALGELYQRFVHQTGMDGGGFAALAGSTEELTVSPFTSLGTDSRFWTTFMPAAYGRTGLALLLGAALLLGLVLLHLLWRRLRGKSVQPAESVPAYLLFAAFAPCFAHYYVFQTHSSFLLHFFAVLKFALPFSLAVALAPGALGRLAGPPDHPRARWVHWTAACLTTVLAAALLLSLRETRQAMFSEQKTENERIGRFIAEHTEYEDVVFSAEHTIQRHFMAYAMKPVHRARALGDIYEVVKTIGGGFNVNLFLRDGDPQLPDGLPALRKHAQEKTRQEDLHLYKVNKSSFLHLYADWRRARHQEAWQTPPAKDTEREAPPGVNVRRIPIPQTQSRER